MTIMPASTRACTETHVYLDSNALFAVYALPSGSYHFGREMTQRPAQSSFALFFQLCHKSL